MKFLSWFLTLSKLPMKALSVALLFFGVLLSVIAMKVVLFFKVLFLTILVLVGAPLAYFGNPWWFEKWILYDCLWNWILGGSIEETISSRLGKWHYFEHAPVFKGRFYFLNQMVSVSLDQVDPEHIRKSIMPSKGKLVSDSQLISINQIDDSLYTLGVNI